MNTMMRDDRYRPGRLALSISVALCLLTIGACGESSVPDEPFPRMPPPGSTAEERSAFWEAEEAERLRRIAASNTTEAEVTHNLSKWTALGLDDYQYVYSFRTAWQRRTATVCVESGSPRVTALSRSGIKRRDRDLNILPPSDPVALYQRTIEDLFGNIYAALDNPQVRVTFDEDLGFPVSVFVDTSLRLTDVFYRFAVSDFREGACDSGN